VRFFELFVFFTDPHAAAVRVCRARRGRVGVAFDLGQHMLDGGVELRVTAVNHLGRIVDHFDVRLYAVALNTPRAIGLKECNGRDGHTPAVDQPRVAGQADQPAPRSRADKFAESGLTEVVGE